MAVGILQAADGTVFGYHLKIKNCSSLRLNPESALPQGAAKVKMHPKIGEPV